MRVVALVLGVVAVLAACSHRLMSTHGADPVIVLLSLGCLVFRWAASINSDSAAVSSSV
jgi:hypothetical protein